MTFCCYFFSINVRGKQCTHSDTFTGRLYVVHGSSLHAPVEVPTSLNTLGLQITLLTFKNSQVIDKGSSRIRKTLESWHTASINHADNNSRPLPSQYSILLKNN